MENLAPPEHAARVTLTHDQARELVSRTVTAHSESLLRTAHRHSLCADDAHDAFQLGMEIFLRRARTLDPASAHKWLHVVIRHEAMRVRAGRLSSVTLEEVDLDRQAAPISTPEERVLGAERARNASEALKRLKPQERHAIWLKASGHSYRQIGEATGFSPTKVNRALTEGRKSLRERLDHIESGQECERWAPVVAAMARGEATAEQVTDARPHLRNCPACRAQLRALHRRPLAAIVPVGLAGMVGRLSGFVERFLPGGDLAVGAAGGTKLAALLATGAAAATAGGGLVIGQERAEHRAAREPTTTVRRSPPAPAGASTLRPAPAPRITPRRRLVTRHPTPERVEFSPHGTEPSIHAPPRARATTPHQLPHRIAGSDTSRGEFSPQP